MSSYFGKLSFNFGCVSSDITSQIWKQNSEISSEPEMWMITPSQPNKSESANPATAGMGRRIDHTKYGMKFSDACTCRGINPIGEVSRRVCLRQSILELIFWIDTKYLYRCTFSVIQEDVAISTLGSRYDPTSEPIVDSVNPNLETTANSDSSSVLNWSLWSDIYELCSIGYRPWYPKDWEL